MTSLLKRSSRMAGLTLLASMMMSPALRADSLPISTPVTVTLDNGIKVLLKPDHSWEYLLEVPAESAPAAISSRAGSTNTNSTEGVPVPTSSAVPVTSAVSSAATVAKPVAATAAHLNSSALDNPQLLSEGHRDGVVAHLTEVSVEDDEAVLQFDLDNTAGQSVIGIQARLRLYADDGRLLATREAPLWVGEYRLPQTYLRSGQTRDSREVRVALPKGEWSRQLVRVEVTEVKFR